jgi:uncharacterized protein (DUF2147 family)
VFVSIKILLICKIKTKHMKRFITLIALLVLASSSAVYSQTNAGDAILGVWETGNGKARVKITKSGNYYYGRIVWLREPNNEEGKPKVDKNNPNENERQTPLLGLRLLKSFEYKGDNLWEDGTIYDPESGSTYNCKISLQDENTMNIRGYIGISAFGRTDVWKRVNIQAK